MGAPSSVLVGLELDITGVDLTAKGEIIPLCLTQTQLRVNRKGVIVLRQQIVNQKKETHPVSFLSLKTSQLFIKNYYQNY